MHLAVMVDVIDGQDPAAVQALGLAGQLAESGHRVTMLARAANECDLDERVTLRVAGVATRWRMFNLLRYQKWLTKTLHSIQADRTISLDSVLPGQIVVPMMGTRRACDRAATRPNASLHERVAQGLHGLLPGNVLTRYFEKRALSSDALEALVALGPQSEAGLLAGARQGVSIHRAQVPIPERRGDHQGASQVRGRLARALGLEPDADWIVLPFKSASLGGLEPMLRAFKPLVDNGADAVLLIAGPVRYTHLAWIAELGLRDHVRLLGKTARLEELMAVCDLIACPTRYDPAGWSVLPALASGKPVITTTASDAAETVRQLGGTVLDSPADPAELLQAIRSHLAGPVSPAPSATHPPPPQARALPEVIEALLADEAG